MSNYTIIWSNQALNNLKNIKQFISNDSTKYSLIVVQEILNSVKNISFFPNVGRIIPKSNSMKYKEIFVYNYRILYKIEEKEVKILNIVHMSQNFTFEDINNL